MKLFLNGLFLLLVIYLQPSPRLPEGVKEAFRTGSAKTLVQYMDEKVALTLLNDDDIYSRAEVQKKLSAFFYANKPNSFTLQYEGGKDANQYAIGILKTANGNYRVAILLRSNRISQLRIEKE